MSQPILSIQSNDSTKTSKAVANLLPCRIHHDGSVGEINSSFWNPTKTDDGKNVAYFRGRKLHGTTVKLPEQYKGVVMEKSDKVENRRHEVDEEVEQEEERVDVGAMDIKTEFDEMVVWGHEASAEAGSDPYVRSIEEWLSIAEQIHSYPSPETKNGA
ncbi:ribonuclease h2 subunit c [Colletotrichum karsti]|uniref:Ribonuclease h2 subunit c n=1 Tax=Colletotrichum karsti TaxID=1095194 RepID=A0A9P6IFS2_9PEZI|nr:ribonuclease h2 subunit c [Colletotrichum karsti]KAF9881619.1 ribonuclease h2 subunit c [Colletotrichum karsti]